MAEIAAFIGLGSNLNEPVKQIERAREAISKHPSISEIAFSSTYNSPPMGPQDQPDYCNAVMHISTELSAMALLQAMQAIENEQGRVRLPGRRWGERTLDLDILLYGQQQMSGEALTVPHPGIAERAFVLYPLYEIAPGLTIPGKGSLADLVELCPLAGLKKVMR